LKIFPEYFRGPLKTLWPATCDPRPYSWTTLSCSIKLRGLSEYLYAGLGE